MPTRDSAESAAKYPAPEGGEVGLRGLEGTHEAPGDESSEDEPKDFVLSEETLEKLPPTERAIAARLLRIERENAQLRASITSRTSGDDDDAEDYEDDPEPEEEPEILKQIPEEGYERLAPVLKEVLGGLIQENKKLHQRLDHMERSTTQNSRMNEFATFKRLHPDWEKYDGEMASIAKGFGFVPSTVDQLEKLYQIARTQVERPSLEAEIGRIRKASPNPKMQSPAPSIRSKMTSSRNGRSPNMREAFNRAWEKSIRESPV